MQDCFDNQIFIYNISESYFDLYDKVAVPDRINEFKLLK